MRASADSDRELLEHMLDCISRIREYTHADRQAFFDSKLVQDAVLRNLQMLAESSQRLSDALKSGEPSWQQMASRRRSHGLASIPVCKRE